MQSAYAFNPVNLHWVLISHANIPLMQSVMRNRKLLAQPSPLALQRFRPLPYTSRTRNVPVPYRTVPVPCQSLPAQFQPDAFSPCFRFIRNHRATNWNFHRASGINLTRRRTRKHPNERAPSVEFVVPIDSLFSIHQLVAERYSLPFLISAR